MQPTINGFKQWFQQHKEAIFRDFKTFLRFKSVATDPQYKEETRKTAEWLIKYLQGIGLDAELWETPGHPCVFASHMKAGSSRPTVLIYHHYDVQPADPFELWDSPPFEPVIKNNNIYARGAQDNKGQCFYSMCALKAFLALCKECKVNIKVFIEGEEESGGSGTFAIVKEKKKQLKADYLLIVDSGIPAPNEPAILLGMRGILAMNIECRNSKTDLHSGMVGGIALNPNRALVSALAKLWDEQGKVTVPGFYDDVEELSSEDRARLDQHFDIEEYKKNFGIKTFKGEQGFSLLESNWIRPVLELNGIGGGYTGAGFKTVIPAVATAKISCRLVPHQNPEKIQKSIESFLREHLPKEMDVRIDFHQGAPAFRSSFDSPIVKMAAKAYEEVFGKKCRFMLCGASIPIVVELQKASGAETALIGVGLPDDDIHAPNEHFGLDRFELGFLIMARILQQCSIKE